MAEKKVPASVPEPAPVQRGIEVTSPLLQWLEERKYSESLSNLIKARREYGLKKYGQGLYSEDGRNTLEDARQEAGDLLQYLFKATLRSRGLIQKEALQELREVLVACQEIILQLEDD